MDEIIYNALTENHDMSDVIDVKPISGGLINESYYVRTLNNECFIKFHRDSPENFFSLERFGLNKLRETNSIHVPEGYGCSDEKGKAYLILEWIEGKASTKTSSLLGKRLADMHQNKASKHGFKGITYIGTLTQNNQLQSEWVDYFRNYRLKGQLQIGIQLGRINGNRRLKLEKLIENIDQYVPKGREASYLHGDLWGGNWIAGPGGNPFLIDPSFLYGDRHFELAFTELFGGFSEQFYQAYNAAYPIDSYYEDVKQLYQLYYLLVHLNIFGETYGGAVDRILKYYIGS